MTNLEVRVVDVLEDESRSARHGVLHHIEQVDDVDSTTEVLQNLDLPLDLLLLDWLKATPS